MKTALTPNIKLLFLGFLILLPHMSGAQEKLDFNVVSFHLDQFSTTAQERQYEKRDGNGDRYAIIKVRDASGSSDLNGFTFNFGLLNSEVKVHEDELWVYVQRNAKTVTIKRPGYKTIEKYDLGMTVQPGCTYIMTLTMSRVGMHIVYDVTKQVLQFVVNPSKEKAVVKVKKTDDDTEYTMWGVVDETGSIDKIMDFGSYDYEVSAPDYVTSYGRVTLSDSKKTFVENVTLKPNFGFLLVDDESGARGAQVFVNDVLMGTVPYNANKRLECGTYKLTITNGDLYKPYNTTITIKQGETVRLSPKLESDFAQTTISVNSDAEILIDGKSKGFRTWKGPLKAGKYVVTCRQENHRETSRQITVKPDVAEEFNIPAPVPIIGSVYVRSTPSGAQIQIDGKNYGKTPQLLQDIIIGNHSVTLSLVNHKTENPTIKIEEGKTANLDVTLSDVAIMKIDSKPSNARLFINGYFVGTTPFKSEMSSDNYEIELEKNKYKTFKETVHLDGSHPERIITLQRQYQQAYSIYLQPFIQVGSNMSMGGSLGGYIANVNVEAFYAMGMKSSEMIYWNSVTTETLERPFSYTYKPTFIGGKVGYGVIVGTRLRITPQTGYVLVSIDGTGNNGDSKGYANSAVIGCKVDYVVASFLSVNITPEYYLEVSLSNNFKRLSNISPNIKGWVTGFNCCVGLSLNF